MSGDVRRMLEGCFAIYTDDSVVRALERIIETARKITKDIFEARGFPFDDKPFSHIQDMYYVMKKS